MASTMLSVQEFRKDVDAAQAAAQLGPVFITEDGQPRRVLIDIGDYERLTRTVPEPAPNSQRKGMSLVEALAMPGLETIDADFEFPQMSWSSRDLDLS